MTVTLTTGADQGIGHETAELLALGCLCAGATADVAARRP